MIQSHPGTGRTGGELHLFELEIMGHFLHSILIMTRSLSEKIEFGVTLCWLVHVDQDVFNIDLSSFDRL